MENPVLGLSPIRGKAKALLLSLFALSVFALSMFPSGASAASENNYSGNTLPGGTWTTGNGVVLPGEYYIWANANTTSNICIGPVTYDGSFHAPYGWSCAPPNWSWVFSDITAAAGLYNPNPGTIHGFNVHAQGR
jgi:hypothetical protein